MEEGLVKVKEIAGDNISVIVDCGTGTGFVTRQAAEKFHNVTFIGFNAHRLRYTKCSCQAAG